MPTYQYGRRVDAIDRDGASMGLDSHPQLSSSPRPTSNSVAASRPPCPPTDQQGQTTSRNSGLQRSPNYPYGPNALLNFRRPSQAKYLREDTDVRHDGPSQSPSDAVGQRYLSTSWIPRPLQRASPLPTPTAARRILPLRRANALNAHTNPRSPTPPRPRRDSAAPIPKPPRHTWPITKTTEVRVSSEPVSEYVKSCGSAVFVERGESDDGELVPGAGDDRYKYTVKVWADGQTESSGSGGERSWRGDLKREVDEAVGLLVGLVRRGRERVRGWAKGIAKRDKD